MKITIEKALLDRAIQQAAAVATATSSMPILKNLLIRATQGPANLRIVGTNLEQTVVIDISDVGVWDEGEITLPAKRLQNILREIYSVDIHIETSSDKPNATIAAGAPGAENAIKINLYGALADDFPYADHAPDGEPAVVDREMLASLLRNVAYAAGTDETKRNIMGVLVECLPAEDVPDNYILKATATDGHRLAQAETAPLGQRITLIGPQKNVIIPRRGVSEIIRMLDAVSAASAAVWSDETSLTISSVTEQTTMHLTLKLIDADYPDYGRVIPRYPAAPCTFLTAGLVHALRRMRTLSDDNYLSVVLAIDNASATLSLANADVGQATETIPVEYAGEPLHVAYNIRYLAESLAVVSREYVRLHIDPTPRATIIRGVGDTQTLGLLMPLNM